MASRACENCGTPDSEKPMCFRGLSYCSDDCRRALGIKIGGE